MIFILFYYVAQKYITTFDLPGRRLYELANLQSTEQKCQQNKKPTTNSIPEDTLISWEGLGSILQNPLVTFMCHCFFLHKW